MVSKYGIEFEERDHGQLFCLESAKDIVKMLLSECETPNIRFGYQTDVHSIEKTESGFSLHADTDVIECESLVVATGGLSMPKLGATPFGYKIAEQFGLEVKPTTAGLVPFTLHKEDKEDFAELSGIAVPAEITANDGTLFKEALLFTHRGLSGPSVLQISSFWKPGQSVSVNLVPEADIDELLARSLEKHPNQSLKNTLARVLPKRLVEVLIERKVFADKPLKQYHAKELVAIREALEHWKIAPNGTEGYRTKIFRTHQIVKLQGVNYVLSNLNHVFNMICRLMLLTTKSLTTAGSENEVRNRWNRWAVLLG